MVGHGRLAAVGCGLVNLGRRTGRAQRFWTKRAIAQTKCAGRRSAAAA